MNYKVISIKVFERQARRLVKKYPSLKFELLNLVSNLHIKPEQGISIGQGCFKIRLAIASKNKGKSGGARVITNFIVRDNTVYLLSVYDKSEKNIITNKELTELLKYIPA